MQSIIKKQIIVSCFVLVMCLSYINTIFAQNEEYKEQKLKYDFYGYLAYQAYAQTYDSKMARSGELYFYPLKPNKHYITGEDLNKNFQANMLTLQSRVGAKIEGPDISNIKTGALIEADFFGGTDSDQYQLRLRHACFTLKWEKLQMLVGHYWHPLFTPECAPDVIEFGAAPAYNYLNCASQIRADYTLTNKIKLIGTLAMYSNHRSVGPEAAQRNAGVPDMQLQAHFNTENFLLGLGGGYVQLEPQETANEYKNKSKVNAFDAIVFAISEFGKLKIKLKAVIGQNLTPGSLLGGYGRVFSDMNNDSSFLYTALISNANWLEFYYKLNKNFSCGFFCGFSHNMGALKKITKTDNPYFYDRDADISHIVRISPRVMYSVNKLALAIEFSYDKAAYTTEFNEYMKPKNIDIEMGENYRVLFAAKYYFN